MSWVYVIERAKSISSSSKEKKIKTYDLRYVKLRKKYRPKREKKTRSKRKNCKENIKGWRPKNETYTIGQGIKIVHNYLRYTNDTQLLGIRSKMIFSLIWQ